MDETTSCCNVCGATVTDGRCMSGCTSFDYDKYNQYHQNKTIIDLLRNLNKDKDNVLT